MSIYVKRFRVLFLGKFIKLALSLLVALVLGTNNHYSTVSFNNFALIAHRFYRRSNFHCFFSLFNKLFSVVLLRLATPRDSAFRQIIRTHFQFYRITFNDSNVIHSKLTGNIRRDGVTVGKLYLEGCIGQRFDDFPFRFDYVVFGHRISLRIFSRAAFAALFLFYSVSISTPSSRTTTVFS